MTNLNHAAEAFLNQQAHAFQMAILNGFTPEMLLIAKEHVETMAEEIRSGQVEPVDANRVAADRINADFAKMKETVAA